MAKGRYLNNIKEKNECTMNTCVYVIHFSYQQVSWTSLMKNYKPFWRLMINLNMIQWYHDKLHFAEFWNSNQSSAVSHQCRKFINVQIFKGLSKNILDVYLFECFKYLVGIRKMQCIWISKLSQQMPCKIIVTMNYLENG